MLVTVMAGMFLVELRAEALVDQRSQLQPVFAMGTSNQLILSMFYGFEINILN